MSDQDNIVGMLRERTEEEDINQILKSSLGGYTKKSVLEYLNNLKKDQQRITETFNENFQSILDEKERITKENQILKSRVLKTEADYSNLSETIAVCKIDDKEYSAESIVNLRTTIGSLQAELRRLEQNLYDSNLNTDKLENETDEKNHEIEQKKQEIKQLDQMLRDEKNKNIKHKTTIADQSSAIFQLKSEVMFLNEIVSEGKTAQLNQNINELMARVDKYEKITKEKDNELSLLKQNFEASIEQNKVLNKTISKLSQKLDGVIVQNEKMAALNESLTLELENRCKNNIALIEEITGLKVEKLVLSRKLDEVSIKLNIVKMKEGLKDSSEDIVETNTIKDSEQKGHTPS